LCFAEAFVLLAEFRVFISENRGCQQGSVDGTCFANGQSSYGHAARHLGDGKEGIQAFERFGFDRHSQDGQGGFGRGHARQVRRPSGSRDNHFDPAFGRRPGILKEQVRRPVCGDDLSFVRHL
jgi:hypothetical protein